MMVYAGLLCGVGYDILRVLRRMLGAGRIATAIVDLLFWLGAALVCTITLIRISHESLRLYALLGYVCGMLLYLAGVSEFIYACLRIPYRAIKTIVDKLIHNHRKNSKIEQNSTE